jgi:hypothetical protein
MNKEDRIEQLERQLQSLMDRADMLERQERRDVSYLRPLTLEETAADRW